jgi:hypothetical protein
MSYTQELADMMHADLCYFAPDCRRYTDAESYHFRSYQIRATAIMETLEPDLGAANVVKAASVFLAAFT